MNEAASSGDTLVAVYGTLKRGFSNHHVMGVARYMGNDRLSQITLYDLGEYPGAVLVESGGIEVEVYLLALTQLAVLDELEEYCPQDPDAGLYTRVQLPTRFGAAWVYLYQGSLEGRVCQQEGAWHGIASSGREKTA